MTEERIKSLKPEDKGEVVLWDSEVRGFGVRCWPSGRKLFILLYRAGGGGRKAPQRRMTLGEVGSVRLADARTAARNYRAGRDRRRCRSPKPAEGSFAARCGAPGTVPSTPTRST